MGIYRIVIAPSRSTDPNTLTLYALDFFGRVWVSNNAAGSWAMVSPQPPDVSDVYTGPLLAVSADGTLYVGSDGGLVRQVTRGSAWAHVEPPGAGRQCTDIVIGRDGTLYSAFRRRVFATEPPTAIGGVFRGMVDTSGTITWTRIGIPSTRVGQPIRLAVGQNRIVVNENQNIWINTIPNLTTWISRGHVGGDGQNGFSLSVAISPTNDNHFIAFGNSGKVTFDGGATFSPANALAVGPDIHQVDFLDSNRLYLACDAGPRFSNDGGQTWGDLTSGPSRITGGPPVAEFYNLNVSKPDQFGRVYASGNAQDAGAITVAGRTTGFGNFCCGELGITVAASRPINSSDTRNSYYRFYGTEAVFEPQKIIVCEFTVPGPDYLAPGSFRYEANFPGASNLDPNGRCPRVFTFSRNISAIAVHPINFDRVLVGLENGQLWRSIAGSDGKSYELIFDFGTGTGPSVTALHFAGPNVAFVGWASGLISRIDNPFASVPQFATAAVPSSGMVVAFASRSAELYAAYAKSVWKSTDNGVSWVEVTGTGNPQAGPLVNNLRSVYEIRGLALDSNSPFMYLATGYPNIVNGISAPQQGTASAVWRTNLPASGTWTAFGDGLPPGIPITGIGIAPNSALYIATQGRGIWWRRDVAAVPPNSGVNSPDAGSSLVGMVQNFTTTCSYPTGWRDIRSIDFKLVMGHGPEDGEPLALWAQFDQDANLIRFYDPDTGEWSEGTPGSNTILASRFAELRLADTRVQGSGPTGPTVEITWAVAFRDAARGRLEQYLRVGDDFEANTSWDKVGVWRVVSPECATDVTAQIEVTRGEPRYKRGRQRYVQQVKVKNAGSTFIPGPIILILERLSEGVTLSNADGNTTCFDPLNRPFVMVRGGARNGLKPGETGVITLKFASPNDQGVDYITEVLAGPGKQ